MEPSQKTIEMVFGFPKAGEVYGSFDVISSNFDSNAGTWSVLFADKVDKKYALQALKPFLGKVAVFEVDGEEHSVEFPSKKVKVEYVRTNPPTGVQTLVQGRFTTNTALQNPTTVEDFEQELGKMTVKKPTKWFRVHPFKEVHSPAFRDKLWSFVTRRGESYGWVVGNEIYHRKGSLIMPYVKINKHVENAKVMYHTHPSKDEPSFSSADDIQWYLDAAYKWNIRHYYTIMANRLDHFEITTKGDKGRNSYLRMDEGKFISDLDTMLTKLEEQYKGESLTDEKFCQKVTRKWVEEINKRFGHILNIKYHSHIKKETPLKNPGSGIPLGVSKRIALDDKHISTALGELKGLDYDWIHYGGDEFAHTMYVYWWTKYHFLPKADGTDRLYMWDGLSKESRVKLRNYLATEVEAGWTRADVLLMLGLYHDIAKRREKEDGRHHSVIGAEMFKQEIGPEIGASQNIIDIISAMLESDVGRRNITDEEFKVIASDMYILTRLFHMADRTAHHPYMFTGAASKAREEGTLKIGDYGEAFIIMRNKEDIAEVESLLMNQVISNPAPKIPYSVNYMASYEIAIDPDTAEMLFEEYDPRKVEGNDGKFKTNFRMSYGQGLYLRMPLRDGFVASATLSFAHPAKLNINSIPSREDYGMSAANEVYQRVGQVLSQVYNPKVERLPIENMEDGLSDVENSGNQEVDVLPAANVSFPIQPMVNPKKPRLSVRGVVQQPSIVLAGPMGSGRREVAKKLTKQGYQICPMHTTQQSPPSRIPMRDSVDHTKESFMQLVKDDEMPYWMMDEKGDCYGYTKEQLNAPKTVMYTSPTMALRMKDTMPHIHIVYLNNNQSLEQHEMKLSSRTGITPRQAKAASKYAIHQKRKSNQFDMVVPVEEDDFDSAVEILNNPSIKVVRRDKTEDGTSHFYDTGTGEDITGKSFDGATLDTNKDIYKVGDPTPIPKGRERFAGGLHHFNIAKWGDRRIIQYSRDSHGFDSIYVEKVDIEGVVYLNSAPFNFREPSAHVMVRGKAEVDWESAKLVTGGEITDFDNNSKSHGEPDTVVKSIKIRPRERGSRYRVNPHTPINNPQYNVEGVQFFSTVPPVKYTNLGAVSAEIEVDRNIPEEIVGNVKDIFFGLIEDYEKKTDKRVALSMAFAIDELTQEVKKRGGNGIAGFTIETGGSLGLPIIEFNKTIPSVIIATGDAIKLKKPAKKLKRNPSKTPEGRKIPKRYLKGLNKEEMAIAANEIDKGYKYDINDPKAYEYWKSDIKATARGYKTVPSKYKKKFIEMYGPLPEKGKFLDKIAKATGIKKSILQKVYNKGLAAWRGGHRPGVQQHQWAAGRVYSFVTLGNTVKKGNKKMPDHSLAIEAGLIKANPSKGNKPTIEEFRQWVDQVNMKNKELQAFLDSDWFSEAGLTPAEAKAQGINSGQNSFRAIMRMRKKLGLTGPKDYIKSGPLTTKKYYEIALKEWSGPSNSLSANEDKTDWGWMKRQNRFNGRASAYPYNAAQEKRKGPLVKKQKTQNKPSRKLLSLWVWGHDPWRWARKHGVANMPKCPDVPWVGMTEKRKYGKIPVLMSPKVKNNPMTGPEYRKNVKKALGKGMLTKKIMYHGSSVANIKKLNTNFNYLVGREVVFATPNYEYALAMAVDSSNDDLDIGYINDEFTIAEMYEGAFDLLKEPSYIYQVSSTGFHQHPRLPPMEYIIEASMPVVRAKRVPNTYKELKRLGTTFVPYR